MSRVPVLESEATFLDILDISVSNSELVLKVVGKGRKEVDKLSRVWPSWSLACPLEQQGGTVADVDNLLERRQRRTGRY